MQSISRTLHSLILSVFIALDAYFRLHVSYIGEKEMLWQTANRFQATTDWLAGVYLSKHVFSLDHAEYLLMRTKAKRIRKKKKMRRVLYAFLLAGCYYKSGARKDAISTKEALLRGEAKEASSLQ